MRATGSGPYYMCTTASPKWQTLEMGQILKSGGCPLCDRRPYHKEQVWKGRNKICYI